MPAYEYRALQRTLLQVLRRVGSQPTSKWPKVAPRSPYHPMTPGFALFSWGAPALPHPCCASIRGAVDTLLDPPSTPSTPPGASGSSRASLAPFRTSLDVWTPPTACPGRLFGHYRIRDWGAEAALNHAKGMIAFLFFASRTQLLGLMSPPVPIWAHCSPNMD